MEPQQTAPQTNPAQPPVSPPVPSQPPAPAAAQPATSPAPKTRKIPKWLKIVGIIVIIFVILIIAAIIATEQGTKNAVKVSNQFVSDIQTDNANSAYSLVTPAFKKTTTQDELSEAFESVSAAFQGTAKVTAKAINKSSGQPDEAIIIYTVTVSGSSKYIRVVLQDNNPWQVLNFRSSDTPLDTSSAD